MKKIQKTCNTVIYNKLNYYNKRLQKYLLNKIEYQNNKYPGLMDKLNLL